MTIRLLGLTEEERLDFEQATGLRTERLFEVIQSQVMAQVEPMVQTSIREVQEVVGPHGSVSRLQAGGVRITREGVRVFNDGVYKTTIDNEGNLFVGSDITDPDNTSMSVFVIDQIYNQEQMGFGDVLLGSNSDDFANIQYDASEGRLNFRGGQTTKVYIDTDGSVVAGSGGVTINEDGIVFENDSGNIFFKDSTGAYDATHGVKISMEGSDGLQIINRGAGDPLGLYITLTDASTPYVQWYETPSEANTAQLEVNAGNTSTRVLIGNDIILRANKDGTETVFNERSNDIDFRIESAANANALFMDAGNEVFYFFGNSGATSVATIDGGTDKRLEIGADHYFPTRSSSNPNGFWNEANQDMDFTFEGDNAAVVLKIDAGTDAAQLGSRVDITSDITPTTLSASVNDYNPTGLSTATVLRLNASSNYDITGLAGGADGRVILIYNINSGSDAITLKDEDTGSAEANRFALFSDITIRPGDGLALIYDGTAARWRTLLPYRSDTYITGLITDERIQDTVGAMFSSNTETGVTVTYQDDDGTIDVEATAALVTNSNDIFRCSGCATSLFTGTINGTPSGTSVVYTPVSGNENVLVPASTSQLAKLRLYNTTRGTSALISNCNTGTNTITLTATVPAAWANGDALTIASQTVSGGGFNWVDLEVTSGDFVGKSLVFLYMVMIDTGGAGQSLIAHPFESYAASKLVATATTQSTQAAIVTHPYKLTSNIISVNWSASGAATATPIIRQSMYVY